MLQCGLINYYSTWNPGASKQDHFMLRICNVWPNQIFDNTRLRGIICLFPKTFIFELHFCKEQQMSLKRVANVEFKIMLFFSAGQGWYMFIAPSDTYHRNDTARLVSPQIRDNTPRCLSFYYHMFGANVNLLNVYTKSLGQLGPGNLVWQRQGTQGLQWLHAMIELKYTVPYQVYVTPNVV